MNKQRLKGSSSLSFKKFFLLEFTKELIRNSGKAGMIQLEAIIKEETKEKVKERIKEIERPKEKIRLEEIKKIETLKQIPRQPPLVRAPVPPRKKIILRIPEPQLPQRFQYLKPIPTAKEIDLEKLNPLIKDPLVKVIECNGPGEHVIVQGAMGRKLTETILSKDEIDRVIRKFSEASKIPPHSGIYRVVVGKLILSSIISEIISSKFIIRKMNYSSSYQKLASNPIRNQR